MNGKFWRRMSDHDFYCPENVLTAQSSCQRDSHFGHGLKTLARHFNGQPGLGLSCLCARVTRGSYRHKPWATNWQISLSRYQRLVCDLPSGGLWIQRMFGTITNDMARPCFGTITNGVALAAVLLASVPDAASTRDKIVTSAHVWPLSSTGACLRWALVDMKHQQTAKVKRNRSKWHYVKEKSDKADSMSYFALDTERERIYTAIACARDSSKTSLLASLTPENRKRHRNSSPNNCILVLEMFFFCFGAHWMKEC